MLIFSIISSKTLTFLIIIYHISRDGLCANNAHGWNQNVKRLLLVVNAIDFSIMFSGLSPQRPLSSFIFRRQANLPSLLHHRLNRLVSSCFE
jgi:hypothetical protein